MRFWHVSSKFVVVWYPNFPDSQTKVCWPYPWPFCDQAATDVDHGWHRNLSRMSSSIFCFDKSFVIFFLERGRQTGPSISQFVLAFGLYFVARLHYINLNLKVLFIFKTREISQVQINCQQNQLTHVDALSNSERLKKCGTLHDFACHPCAGAMLIFSVSFQF